MITAKNYAAQAERALGDVIEALHSNRRSADVKAIEILRKTIGRAQHFALPDGGRLFDDRLRGLRGETIRLPFPAITVEYWMNEERLTAARPTPAPKRLIVATEAALADRPGSEGEKWAQKLGMVSGDRAIVVSGCCWIMEHWAPLPIAWILPPTWDQARAGEISVGDDPASPDTITVVGVPTILLRETVAASGLGPDIDWRSPDMVLILRDIVDEVYVLLELIEALSCSNVGIESLGPVVPAAVNAKRARAGKLPLYETKILTVSVPGGVAGAAGTGHHASPRQHLRRGHIRRLHNGGRKIWINSMVVGRASDGRVDKSYAVSA